MDYIITFMETYGYAAMFIAMVLENANIPIPSEIVLGFAGYLVAQGVFDMNMAIIVGTVDDAVIGYASLSPYRLKDAFKSTVELSIYIHQEYRGKGVATQLMARILEMAREDDTLHNVVSVITAGNEGSTKLHERFGFTYCGLTPEVGFKHGVYRDTETYALLV